MPDDMNPPAKTIAGEEYLASLINGYRATAITYTAIELDLPDRLGDEAVASDTLARDLHLQADLLYRLLRAMSALGLCEERAGKQFVLTEAGRGLKSGTSSPLRELTQISVEQYFPAWAGLSGTLRNGRPAFENLHGAAVWQARAENPRFGSTFNVWLAKETTRVARLIAGGLDLTGVSRLADIGGGLGQLTCEILRVNPDVTGILFDQPAVIEAARRIAGRDDIAARMEFVAGSFFAGIPVKADAFLLKSVLHDWSDAEARQIVAKCRQAMDGEARLLVIERALPEHPMDDVDTILLDMHMMAVTGGKERKLADFIELLRAEGFVVGRVESLSRFSLIEARTA